MYYSTVYKKIRHYNIFNVGTDNIPGNNRPVAPAMKEKTN